MSMHADELTFRQRVSQFRHGLSRTEWLRLAGMGLFIVALHLIGWGVIALLVAPHHYTLGTKTFGFGIGLAAYTLGMRHAFDADHIAAIDNTTRKLMHEGKRPLSGGFWFSLGHSTVVFALAFLLALGVKAIVGPVQNDNSSLHHYTGLIGTSVSGTFLLVIAAINVVILVGILKVFRDMRRGIYDEDTLEDHLNNRGLMNRLLAADDEVDHQARADVPGRGAVRARLRHRERGRPSGVGVDRRGQRPAVVRRSCACRCCSPRGCACSTPSTERS